MTINRCAAHEIPYLPGDEVITEWRTYKTDLAAALDADGHAQALRLFMRLAGSSDDDLAVAESDRSGRRYEPSYRPCATRAVR